MLVVNNIKTGYGKKLIVDDVSLYVKEGEIVTLLGHNGAGKSTILKSIIGVLPLWSGDIHFNNHKVSSNTNANVKSGITIIPQGNQVFNELTVYENIEISFFLSRDNTFKVERIRDVLNNFPILKARKKFNAGKLSGGEQQQLSLAMALIQKPKLILMDEPSLGLSPPLINKTFKIIHELNYKHQISILIVEQKVKEVLKIAHRAYVLRLGKVALEDTCKNLQSTGSYKNIFLS